MRVPYLAVLALLAAPVLARAEPPAHLPPQEHPVLRRIVDAVSVERLRAIDTRLVGFGTRHTLSDTRSGKRGIGAARRWVRAQFESISAGCEHCLRVITPSRVFKGKRTPAAGVEVKDIVAIQKGSDANRYIIMTAHLDSRVSDVMDATSDAPGADDDGSGVAALIEVARVLSKYKFAATLVYSADSGEEQGLYGGRIIADYARDQGWNVEANLNNDMIGNSHGSDGVIDNTTARIFSEAVKSRITPEQLRTMRYTGGFVDSPSRNVARYIAALADRHVPDLHFMLMYRQDRFRRGGDQIAFNRNGFPAVRINETHENWRHQHQDVRVEKGMQYGDLAEFVDFPFLAKMTAANAIAMASMAWAPAPPEQVRITSNLSPDTQVSWQPVSAASGYRIYWRATDAPMWQHSIYVGQLSQYTMKNKVIDNSYFGVASVSGDGFESPVVFPGPGGAFSNAGSGSGAPEK